MSAVSRTARMHALWSRISSGPLEPEFHTKLLKHHDATVRAWGVRAAGNQRQVTSPIKTLIEKMAGDLWPDVGLQVAIAARKLEGASALALLLEVQQSSAGDVLIPRIVWQNLLPMIDERQADLARLLEERKTRGKGPGVSALIPRTIERLLESRTPDAAIIARVLSASRDDDSTVAALDLILERFRDHSLPGALEESLRKELDTALQSLFGAPDHINEFLTIAQVYLGNQESLKDAMRWARSSGPDDGSGSREKREELRIRAVQAILYRKLQGTSGTLIAAILAEDESHSSTAFRGKVLDALASAVDPEVAPAVLKAYPVMPQELKSRAVELLTERPAWTLAFLGAVAAKQIPTSILNVTQLRKLQKSHDARITAQVKAIWGAVREGRDPKRERVANSIRDLVRRTPGNPVSGQAVFKKVCAVSQDLRRGPGRRS